ncbi:hypothetical protein N9E62_02290 [Salibacteraceae bacterium]|nr:hypothetical protein [Salibacteraceae bacterium]
MRKTNSGKMKKALPYIAIIGTSAFIGNLLVIGLGLGMYWQTLEPMEFMRQFGIQFPLLLAPTMGILLPAIIATVAMVMNTKGQPDVRKNWVIALVGLMIACTITSLAGNQISRFEYAYENYSN